MIWIIYAVFGLPILGAWLWALYKDGYAFFRDQRRILQPGTRSFRQMNQEPKPSFWWPLLASAIALPIIIGATAFVFLIVIAVFGLLP